MSIKKELQEYYWIMKAIARLEEQLFEAETKATSASQVFSNEPRGGSVDKDKICCHVVAIIEYQNTINRKLKEAYELKNKIEIAIDGLPTREQHLVRLRYIDRLQWEEICLKMNYSKKQVHRIHLDGLEMLQL